MESNEEWDIKHPLPEIDFQFNKEPVFGLTVGGMSFTLGRRVPTFYIIRFYYRRGASDTHAMLPLSLETYSSQFLFSVRLLIQPSYFAALRIRPSQAPWHLACRVLRAREHAAGRRIM